VVSMYVHCTKVWVLPPTPSIEPTACEEDDEDDQQNKPDRVHATSLRVVTVAVVLE
jgi:hypothetical protein